MGKKTKGKHRLDKFYHLAKEQGFRSRAAFKLIQLNRQHHFLEHARGCVDLCAAPGGWMQVARKTVPVTSVIVGVDLDKIRPVQGCKALIGDITKKSAHEAIAKEMGQTPVDVVLHDGAPNVGGAWASEAYTQSALVLEALRCATRFLTPGGAFVTKVFRSQDYTALLYAFRELFKKVAATKPAASRDTSAEIFVVCLGYRAPAKIDPRLLDPKHLFKEVSEEARPMGPDALLRVKKKQKRQRQGYEEGLSSTHRAASSAAFVLSDTPVELLGQCTKFIFDGPESEVAQGKEDDAATVAAFVRAHPTTTEEIRTLASDLPVLGRSEFKLLLKWRLKLVKDLAAKQKVEASPTEKAAEEPSNGSDQEEDEEVAVLEEMAGVKARMEARNKRERRRLRELRKKSRIRAAQLAAGEGLQDDNGNEGLFSLASIQGKAATDVLQERTVPDDAELADSSDTDAEAGDADAHASGSEDSEDDRRRYDAKVEEGLDEAYRTFLERHKKREAALQAKRARLGVEGELSPAEGASSEDEGTAQPQAEGFQDYSDEEKGAGLLVELDEGQAGRRGTPAAIAAQWYAQDLFAGVDDDDEADEVAPRAHQGDRKRKREGEAIAASKGQGEDEEAQSDSSAGKLVRAVPLVAELKPAKDLSSPEDVWGSADAAGAQAGNRGRPTQTANARELQPEPAGFEEVAMGWGDDSSDESDEELDNLDDNSKAEILAVARKMLHGRQRQDILDMSYHRYNFHDDGMPRWFMEDEQRHCRRPQLVTKADVEAEKDALRAIDARPIKKVAEAKARKQRRLAVRIEAAKQKAEAVAAQEDLSAKQKAKQVEQIMARAKSGKGAKKGKPSRSAAFSANKKKRPLDGRLRADKRQVNLKVKKKMEKKGKGKGRGKGSGGGSGKKANAGRR